MYFNTDLVVLCSHSSVDSLRMHTVCVAVCLDRVGEYKKGRSSENQLMLEYLSPAKGTFPDKNVKVV